jgi:hypothetical protein
MRRYWKLLAPISCGGVTLGWLQAFGMVNFSNVWTDVLAFLFTALINAIFGVVPLNELYPGGLFA